MWAYRHMCDSDVRGARCSVQGAGCRVQGLGCRVQGGELGVVPAHVRFGRDQGEHADSRGEERPHLSPKHNFSKSKVPQTSQKSIPGHQSRFMSEKSLSGKLVIV